MSRPVATVAILIYLLPGTSTTQPITVPECVGGKLISTQPDAITVKLNQTVRVIHITPDTELLPRGVDLDSPAKLVLGEQVYPVCKQIAADGRPIAILVAAAELEGDAMYLEPHHVHEVRSCGGGLVKVTPETVTTRTDDGKIYSMHVTPETVVWRGEVYHDTAPLRLGDDITARCVVHYPDEQLTAEEIWANVTATEGVILKVLPDRIIVNQYPGADKHSAYPRGHATVILDAHTHFDNCTRKDLKIGVSIRAQGLEIGKHGSSRFVASVIIVYK